MERRAFSAPVELRADGDGLPAISGYAAVFYRAEDPGTQYQLWRGAYERISPGAFDEALNRKDDVRALFNHDHNQVLGRTKAGTLTLSVDSVGLRYTVTPADTAVYRDLVTLIKRGDVDGSSFSFSIVGEDFWYRDELDNEIRDVRNVKLFDVSPVTYPAYQAASTEARSARDNWAAQLEQQRAEKIKREAKIREMQLRALTRLR